MRNGDPYYKPDTIILCGASNTAGYGSPIASWPLDQTSDRSALHVATWAYMPDENWSYIRPWPSGLGGMLYTLVQGLRCRGLNPAISHALHAGTPASYWAGIQAALCAWHVAKLALLTQPNVRALIVDNGTTDAQNGPGTDFQANWTPIIAALRSALGKPNLPLIMVATQQNYDGTNGALCPYRAVVRAQQAALVAADAHATLVDYMNPSYVDGFHMDYSSASRAGYQLARIVP